MREEGKGWGQIAYELGLHPSVLGMGHTKKTSTMETFERKAQMASTRDFQSASLAKGHSNAVGKSEKGNSGYNEKGAKGNSGNKGNSGGNNGGGKGKGGGNKK